jgi:cytochrome b subunit of formate dehydrogenase
LLFLLGLYFFIGITGIIKFFTKKGKLQGSLIYFSGLVVVVFGFTFFGVLFQIAGFFIIFRSFLPDFYDYVCRLPVIGHYLSIDMFYFRKLSGSECS